jgi:hypothetical protein
MVSKVLRASLMNGFILVGRAPIDGPASRFSDRVAWYLDIQMRA